VTKRWVVGNWKLNKTCAEARAFTEGLATQLHSLADDVACIIAPPFTALQTVASAAGPRLGVAAQNIYAQDAGAFTGEISAPLAAEAGATYTLVGHSERRALFHETDGHCAHKLLAAARAGLCPILCVGESAQDRAQGRTAQVVQQQIQGACDRYLREQEGPLMVAYEPIWAIGTGHTPAPQDAQAVHAVLVEALGALMPRGAKAVPLLYGGSVTADNAAALVSQQDIHGVLVGGASLTLQSFVRIAQALSA
jgi:triosephosphate isomerase